MNSFYKMFGLPENIEEMSHEEIEAWREKERLERQIAHDLVDGGELDTIMVKGEDNIKPYETALSHLYYNEGMWVILETYDTRDQAIEGHKKWLEIVKTKPPSLVGTINSVTLSVLSALANVSAEMVFPRIDSTKNPRFDA